MAGLIAGHGRIQGVAPRATVLPVRVNRNGTGNATVVAEGIKWALEHGAKVISISLAGKGDVLLQQWIDHALEQNVVVVAGAGNSNKSSSVQHPAAYPGVLASCGISADGAHAEISVRGPELMLCAPAEKISSADIKLGYSLGTGTSDATALIAGAAALVRSKYPDLSAAEVVHRLTATAIDKGPAGRDDTYGYGVLNIVDALTKVVPPLGVTVKPATTQAAPAAVYSSPSGLKDMIQPWHIALGGLCLATLALAGGFWAYAASRRRRTRS
jgi:subtilisin family serine protease